MQALQIISGSAMDTLLQIGFDRSAPVGWGAMVHFTEFSAGRADFFFFSGETKIRPYFRAKRENFAILGLFWGRFLPIFGQIFDPIFGRNLDPGERGVANPVAKGCR